MSKHSTGKSSIYQNSNENSNFLIGRVVENVDPADGNRIKVRIKGIDDHIIENSDLAFCNPFLPKFLSIVPNVGETVFIIVPSSLNNFENRVYVGPIISQPQRLENDSHFYTSMSLFDNGFTTPDESPSTIPEANGVYPKKNEIALQGRKNTDFIFKDSQVLIRAGKHAVNNNLLFNKNNPAYLQLNFNTQLTNEDGSKSSVSNLVADKINLLTHSGSPNFNLKDQGNMISDAELTRIVSEAHPMVFGDNLVEFLNLVKEFIANHIHPYHGLPADKTKNVTTILNFDLNTLLSNNIKLN